MPAKTGPDSASTLETGGAASRGLLTGPLAPVVLVLTVGLVYLPSLGGGFLNMDDPWLIRNNRIVRRGLDALRPIWTDFTYDTRLELGGEFLPIRDMSVWLEVHAYGLDPQAMRVTNLALYVIAVLLLRAALLRIFGGGVIPEVTSWLFALHPAHVESVAWLAGRKDVLALVFVGLALYLYAGDSWRRIWTVPLSVLLAVLSKSMSVAVLGLLPAVDLLARQKPDWKIYVPTVACASAAMIAHWYTGALVGITTDVYGGSRLAAAAAMGRVWLYYVEAVFFPGVLSIVHDPPKETTWDVVAVGGWLLLVVWGVVGTRLARSRPGSHREGNPLALAAWLWFVVPLAPVSQVLVPLENFLADRYLFLSVMGPALLVGGIMGHMGDRRALGGTFVLAGGLALFTWQRANLFADSVSLFADATEKTERSPKAPYQLGQAYEAAGADEPAMAAYREVLARATGRREEARRATNNLAKLLARRGRLARAEKVLRRGRRLWPRDPKVLGNLAEVVARQPRRSREARALYDELLRSFPDYEFGRRAYERRYGPPRR